MLLAQDQYVQAVSLAHKEACEVNGRKYVKDERLRELLKAPHLRRVPRRARGSGNGGEGLGTGGGGGGGGGSVPMPLDPTVQVRDIKQAWVRRGWGGDIEYVGKVNRPHVYIGDSLLYYILETSCALPTV